MKIRNIAFIILAIAFVVSCASNKESEKKEEVVETTDSVVEEAIPEEPSMLVKAIEINQDGAVDSKVTFEYDELDRLIKATTHRNIGTDDEWISEATVAYGDGVITCEGRMRELTLTLDADSTVKKSEMISEGEGIVLRYLYKSGKLSQIVNEIDCGNKYTWDGGNVNVTNIFAPSCDESYSFDSVEYTYGDVDRPNIDVLAFSEEFGDLPQAASVAPKGIVSKFMPTERKTRVYSDALVLMGTTIVKYTYTTDEFDRVSTIEYNSKVYYDGGEDDLGNWVVKVMY